ncbi:MAG: hypothetical protein H7Y39_15470 [Nitrospiraceae bacterium]|nr:hypothetical protein [Nitrospiraceae bacterium]
MTRVNWHLALEFEVGADILYSYCASCPDGGVVEKDCESQLIAIDLTLMT